MIGKVSVLSCPRSEKRTSTTSVWVTLVHRWWCWRTRLRYWSVWRAGVTAVRLVVRGESMSMFPTSSGMFQVGYFPLRQCLAGWQTKRLKCGRTWHRPKSNVSTVSTSSQWMGLSQVRRTCAKRSKKFAKNIKSDGKCWISDGKRINWCERLGWPNGSSWKWSQRAFLRMIKSWKSSSNLDSRRKTTSSFWRRNKLKNYKQ